ncbi:hypothetical protein [Pseudonocardia cypriaca]|uniref:PH (Pleckstrin Homology) domain-containing protein n=1 Tax=Pseudonocardia cypriaca TaxID=882449 RepID=A0A543FT69_9PSEU|nr:hypothetical protein [Pseudonocardia cypriaca]TQM36993.1 hypothetical protein FB388_4190 [Pseudonocardia cypriaca]
MKVRFARWLGISFMVAGVAAILVCLGIAFSGMPEVGLVVGIVLGPGFIAFGWLYLDRLPYFILTDANLVVPIQPVHSRALNGGRLTVDGVRLVIVRPGEEPEKLPVYRWYAHPDDWAKVVATITQGGLRH